MKKKLTEQITAEFEFRPIGQGLFYTGEIIRTDFGNKFTMVYGCGVSGKSTKK